MVSKYSQATFHCGAKCGLTRTGRLGLVGLMILFICGCPHLPEVKPFADATGNLATAVSSVQSPTATAIAQTYDPSSQQSKNEAAARAIQFKEQWAARVRVVNAFASYSEGLAAVAAAGENGQAAARQVTEQFSQLINTVNPPAGTGMVANAVAAAGAKIYAEIARWRAAATLADAVNRNQGYVRELAEALNEDWETVKKSFVDSSYDMMMTVALSQSESDRTAIAEIEKARPALRMTVVEGAANPPQDDTKRRELAEARQRLEALDNYYNAIVSKASYQKSLKDWEDIKKQKADLIALIDQAELVTTQWAAAHNDLADALRDGKTVSFKRLLQLSEELIQIYQNARKK